MYLLYADDFQRPRRFISASGIPFIAADVSTPILKE